jgi:hypothetical protein
MRSQRTAKVLRSAQNHEPNYLRVRLPAKRMCLDGESLLGLMLHGF